MQEVMNEIVRESALEKFLKVFGKVDFSFDSEASRLIREKAKSKLEKLDFPTTKTEYWKYTRVTPLMKGPFEIRSSEKEFDIDAHRYPAVAELVFVNGFFREDLSRPVAKDGLVACSLSAAKEDYEEIISEYLGKITIDREEVFTQLNNAYHNDGAFVMIDAKAIAELPVHIIHLAEGDKVLAQPRNLVIARKESSVKIIESFMNVSGSGNMINSLSEIFSDERASVEYDKIQDLAAHHHISTEQVDLQKQSQVNITTISLSGKLIRNNLNAAMNGESGNCRMNGLYLARGEQHMDNHTFIDHIAPHCESNEIYKGILNERSTGVFNGKVLVERTAQKTNAFQYNANILLTDEATANSKPELEIYADDVKCSHGSTTGQLDEEALFYLQARGIEKEKARNLLLHAFAGEVINRTSIPEIKERIGDYIAQRYHYQN